MLKRFLLVSLFLVSLAGCTIDAIDAVPPAQQYTRQLLRDRLDPDLNVGGGRR